MAQLVKSRRVTTNAPPSNEGDRAGGAAHVDGHSIVEHTARSSRSDRPSTEPAIFVQPLCHWPVAGTDPVSVHLDDDPQRKPLLGLGDDRPRIAGHVSAARDVRR